MDNPFAPPPKRTRNDDDGSQPKQLTGRGTDFNDLQILHQNNPIDMASELESFAEEMNSQHSKKPKKGKANVPSGPPIKFNDLMKEMAERKAIEEVEDDDPLDCWACEHALFIREVIEPWELNIMRLLQKGTMNVSVKSLVSSISEIFENERDKRIKESGLIADIGVWSKEAIFIHITKHMIHCDILLRLQIDSSINRHTVFNDLLFYRNEESNTVEANPKNYMCILHEEKHLKNLLMTDTRKNIWSNKSMSSSNTKN